MNEELDIKLHPFYQRGYSRGYVEGFNAAFEKYQDLILRAQATQKIEIICKELVQCPFKKEAK